MATKKKKFVRSYDPWSNRIVRQSEREKERKSGGVSLFLLRPCSSGSTSLAGLFYLFSSSSPSSLARSLPPYPPRPLSLSLSLSLPFAAAAASVLLLLLLLPLLLPLLVFFVFLPSALSLWPLPFEKSRIRIVTTRREEQRESVGRAGRSGGGAAVSISSADGSTRARRLMPSRRAFALDDHWLPCLRQSQ